MNERHRAARFALHLEAADGDRTAVELIAAHCDLSRQRIKTALSRGAVWLENGRGIHRSRRAGKRLAGGERLHFYHDPRVLDSEPPAARLVADEGDYSVWDKPAGMFSQGSKWGDHWSIARWAETRLDPSRPAWPVHRLDRATRGLILLAHRRRVATALATLFENRAVDKLYQAVIDGRLDVGQPLPIDLAIAGKPARSLIERGRYDASTDTTTLTIRILTGRKHQVRRHLQALGRPIVGDRLYGGRLDGDLRLTAAVLAFRCPLTDLPRCYRIDAEED